MKKNILSSKNLGWILAVLAVFGMAQSCRKSNSLGYTPGTGAPTITSVSKISRSVTDTMVTTVVTYDTTGTATVTIDSNKTHQSFIPVDSTTTTGDKQQYYAIHGNNLGTALSVTFNGYNAYFNRAYGDDHTIIVNIPLNVPTLGDSATNKLVVVTQHGKATFNFTTLTPPPTVAAVSTTDFLAGSTTTLTGVGFASVSAVGLTGTSDKCTIVSQSDAQLVIKFPTTTVATANLVFSYTSAGKTLTVNSKDLFINLDQAYQIFTDDFQNGWYANSWGPTAASTTVSKTGSASLALTYPKGNWWANGVGSNVPLQTAGYKYLAFWIKGGKESYTLFFTADTRGGFANSDQGEPVSVPANDWTYIKLPLSALNIQGSQHFGFWIMGPNDQDEIFYIDDLVLLKQ